MQKSKLGINISLLGSFVCFVALIDNYVLLGLAVGYILLVEENPWLKRNSLKVCLVTFIMDLLMLLLSLIPKCINLIDSMVSIFHGYFSLSIVSSIVSVFDNAIEFMKFVILLVLLFKALNQGTVRISVIDRILDKNIMRD